MTTTTTKGAQMLKFHPLLRLLERLQAVGFAICWRALSRSNAVPLWFVWCLLRGEAWRGATWQHAQRIAGMVTWAEKHCGHLKATTKENLVHAQAVFLTRDDPAYWKRAPDA